MSEPIPDPAETAAFEADTDAAIKVCGGDPRAAVRALVVANRCLEKEINRLAEAVSAGFTRGRVGRPVPAVDRRMEEHGPNGDHNNEQDRGGVGRSG